MALKTIAFAVLSIALTACSEDPSASEFGGAEAAVKYAGTVSCKSPEKSAVCHVPPGRPAAAHSICVDRSANESHQYHHDGDSLGACNADTYGATDVQLSRRR